MTYTLAEWIELDEEQRLESLRSWDVTADEGRELAQSVLSMFAEAYSGIDGVHINERPQIGHGSEWVFVVNRPFIYDRRTDPVPGNYMGFTVRVWYDTLPPDFDVDADNEHYAWAPSRFEAFVDAHLEEIARELDIPDISRTQALDAIAPFGNFARWREQCP